MPLLAARLLYPARWLPAATVMLATLLVDLDHLLAQPIYDPLRCSIGFHPLHRWWAVLVYLGLTAWPRTRWVGLGLLIHMGLDALDCLGMPGGAAALSRFLPGWPAD